MKLALPWLLLVALMAHVGAHGVIAAALARKRLWRQALAALLVPPLAPFWGWREQMRTVVYVWVATLVVFALGVAAA